jgi:hypothetical protein
MQQEGYRTEYKSRTTWLLHLNNTVKQKSPPTNVCREYICDAKKYLQNVSLSREQQSTFLALQSRFHLEYFIYFSLEKCNRIKADYVDLSIATM